MLEVHQQPQLGQMCRPWNFLDPRLRGDDEGAASSPPPRKNVIPAQAGIQKVDFLETGWPIPTGEAWPRERWATLRVAGYGRGLPSPYFWR